MKFSDKEIKIIKLLLIKTEPEKKYRKNIWMVSSGAKQEMKEHPNYYLNLLKNYPEEMCENHYKIILKDLPRTFINKEEEKIYLKRLENILIAYSRRNPFIGYCQGFNFIVAFILKIVEKEEESFWLFVQIIEKILPLNYYSNVLGVLVYSSLIEQLLSQFLPELFDFIQRKYYEIHITNILYKWLLSLFVEGFPEKLSLRIWDALFLNGDIILFKASLGILKLLKNEIMNVNSIEELSSLFDIKIKQLQDPSIMIYFLFLRKFDFDIKQLYLIRIEIENQIQNSFNQKNKKNSSPTRKSRKITEDDICQCNPEEIQNYLVLKFLEPIEIIDSYCDNYDNYQNDFHRLSIKSKNEIWNEMLVNRRFLSNENDDCCPCRLQKKFSFHLIFTKVKNCQPYLSFLKSFNGV